VNFENSVANSSDLYQSSNTTTWKSNTTIIPRGNYYARILGNTISGTDFAIYAFPAFESVAEPSRFSLIIVVIIFCNNFS